MSNLGPAADTSTPLAIYIHWPFCKSKCPYCDFNSHVREHVAFDDWQKALLSELDYQAALAPGRNVGSIFFGGGTPSLMPPSIAEALIKRVHQHWQVIDNVEITLEANPTSVEAATFKDFKGAGVNRVSLGVQSLRDSELRFLGREHSAKEALHAVDRARQVFDRYSFDLIYARPNQTITDWEKELAEALQYAGRHLSLYQLTIEENTAFYHAYAKGGFTLPDDEEAESLYRLTETMLADKGLVAYEVSNYAAPGEESHHNMAYWLGDEYMGIGPGAHGRLNIKNARQATLTQKSPERWLEAVKKQRHGLENMQPMQPEHEAQERLMMGLRLRHGIAYDDFEQRSGFSLLPYINTAKRDFYIEQGLLERSDTRLIPTLAGRLVLTRLTADLLLEL